MTSLGEPSNGVLEWEDILLDNESVSQDDLLKTKDDNNGNYNVNGDPLIFEDVNNCFDDDYGDDDDDDNDTLYCEDTASEYRTPPGSPKLFYSSDETLNQSPYLTDNDDDDIADDDYKSFDGQSTTLFRSNSIGVCNESLKLPYHKQTRSGSLVDQLLNDIHFTLRKTDYRRRCSRGSDTSSLSPPDFTYRIPHVRKANLLAKGKLITCQLVHIKKAVCICCCLCKHLSELDVSVLELAVFDEQLRKLASLIDT